MAVNLRGMAPLLTVFDMPASLAFYRVILGFEVVQSSGQGDDAYWVLLRYNTIELILNTAFEKSDRPAAPDGYHLCLHWPLEDVKENV
jgi:glyoxylase I family protein